MTDITIAVLAGTTREQRQSIQAARYITNFGAAMPGIQTILVDPNDFNFPGDGNDPEGKDPRYTEIIRSADALIIVTPEYNHSFPGSLKRMLDSELALYYHMPAAVAGVSNGQWGGTRAVESLIPALRTMGMITISYDVYFPKIQDIFDTDGKMKNEYAERYQRNLGKAFTELIWMARAMKQARQDDPSSPLEQSREG